MIAPPLLRMGLLAASLNVLFAFDAQAAQAAPVPTHKGASAAARDGQRDFDWEIGAWKTRVSRLQSPLSGNETWLELEGTTVVRKLFDGRANLAELDIAGPSGRIQGISLRLYEPQARQWNINYANLRSGTLTAPIAGAFKDGRGEFFGRDTFDGRPILVRFVIECATRDVCRFEQAFSADDGKRWELNWIATDTRIADPTPTE
ncbi:hypothetical protein [Lysobacter antibioticus]|uniref:hypothetical protein n=1 Tax=Lysobacter antibioticus TaxID=84531 RepID=UPI00071726CC|nr:hypothetical protein [Lysobacter antibioticus]